MWNVGFWWCLLIWQYKGQNVWLRFLKAVIWDMTWEVIHWNHPFNFGLRILLLACNPGHWASRSAPLGLRVISGAISPGQFALCNSHLKVTLGTGRYSDPNPIWYQLCKINTSHKLSNGTFLWLVSPSCTNHRTWWMKEMGLTWRAPRTWDSADWGCVPFVWLAWLGNWKSCSSQFPAQWKLGESSSLGWVDI